MSQQENISIQKIENFENVHVALAEKIARWTKEIDQLTTEIPGLSFRRYEATTEPASYMHEPSICLVAQGAKRVLLGEEMYIYDAYHFLITSVNLPVIAQVIEASKQEPYLGIVLKLDLKEIAQLMLDSKLPLPLQSSRKAGRGMVGCRI